MVQLHGFYNVSGYCFLIWKFPVVPLDAKKWGYKNNFMLPSLACTLGRTPPHFQKHEIALVSNQINKVACPTHPETFMRGSVIAPFLQLTVVIVLFPRQMLPM